MSAGHSLDEYFQAAASWDHDRMAQMRRSVRVAWRIAGAGCCCALACAVALASLMPLKRVDPFVIRVDNSNGAVDVVPVYTGEATMHEAVTRYFLTHYVSVCERFTFATAESDYEECGAFHAAQRNQAWLALWSTNNPASPLNVHKDGSSVRVQVRSVSFFKRANGVSDLAQVRYLKAQRQGNGAEEQYTSWIGTLQYAYVKPSADPKMRRWNPLGFKIIEFETEREVLPEESGAGRTERAARPQEVSH